VNACCGTLIVGVKGERKRAVKNVRECDEGRLRSR
jgi:hypothetical protein